MNYTDEQLISLVSQAKGGDKQAFSSLYSLYYKRLYRTAFSIMKHTQEAEDVVSDTVVAAFRSLHSLRDDMKFESWLFTLLYNTAKHRLKSSSRNRHEGLNEELSGGSAEHDAADGRVSLASALSKLSDTENAIITLAVMNGYSSDEVGRIMSLKPATVRSKQARALSKLRQMIGDFYV